MFQYMIDDMFKATRKIANSPGRPPETVLIKQKHAEYLGVKSRPNPREVIERRKSGLLLPRGKQIDALVDVSFQDLYVAVTNAEGIDEKERREELQRAEAAAGKLDDREGQTEDPVDGQELSSAEE